MRSFRRLWQCLCPEAPSRGFGAGRAARSGNGCDRAQWQVTSATNWPRPADNGAIDGPRIESAAPSSARRMTQFL